MDAFKQFDDLENHFIKVTAVVNNFEKYQQNQQNYAVVIDKLNGDIENLRNYNKSLNQQLLSTTSYSEEENQIHTIYVNLKEKYNQLERSYFKIEKKNLFIEQNHSLNVMKLEENFQLEKERINQENLKKIEILQAKLAEEKAKKLTMEGKLQNELQILQASLAIQIDDTQSLLQTQLREANNKIHELNYSSNIMRNELSRVHMMQNASENAIKENKTLKKKLEALEHKLIVAEEELLMYKSDSRELDQHHSGSQQFASASFQERLFGQDIYESKIVENNNTANSSKKSTTVIPPLKSPPKPMQPKKRRLFDANSLDYLKQYEQPR